MGQSRASAGFQPAIILSGLRLRQHVGCGEPSEPYRSREDLERCGSRWSPHPTRYEAAETFVPGDWVLWVRDTRRGRKPAVGATHVSPSGEACLAPTMRTRVDWPRA